MRVLKSDFKSGVVKIRVQSLDDLWYLNKIITSGSEVSGVTFRKIQSGEKEGERKRVFLKIRVEKKDFRDFTDVLKLLGIIIESRDERVPTGEHHSFNISINDELIIEKVWNNIDKNYLKKSQSKSDSNLMIVSCDYGDAIFAFYHEYGIEYSGSLSEEIGGKKELKSYEKNKEKFLQILLSTINQVAKQRSVNKVLIGGASMITDNLNKLVKNYDYLKNKTVFSKINYSGKNGINELIRKGEVDKILSDNVYSSHVKLVNKVLELIGKNGKVTYGLKHVKLAVESGAVKDLIISDKFVKNNRNELDKLIQLAQSTKSNIHIIPSNTEHGEKIDSLTGISAILRFK